MTQTISMPIWAFILILLFATVTFASHFLFPSVRWFFRKRAERLVAQLNTKLQRPIEPFKLARRYDMIQRLLYDPRVTQAIVEHAHKENIPENVAFEQARRYAREIVPSFSATAYFTVGARLSKFLSKAFYRVRLGSFDRQALEKIDPDATVIFVMNHRSNMDYVLVTYLVSRSGALSYAVGEWARVWPLSVLIRAMGAYFIRRRSRGLLYRRVLARYVQMATNAGVTQAMFPEGGLSLTGHLGAPKLGLLNYIVADRDSDSRDVIFVPVGLNYDRVFEDKFLVRANTTGVRRFRPSVFSVLKGTVLHIWGRLSGRFKGFGTASVGFGTPLELSSFASDDPELTEAVATELMKRIAAVVPVLASPLMAHVILNSGATTKAALTAEVEKTLADLTERKMPTPRRKAEPLVAQTLERFALRGFLELNGEQVSVTEEGRDILAYYANTIAHHFGETDQ
jgi:glycerol-3-phosphate O-acyltransferase